MIITVTLSPTIDKTIYVEGFKLDSINNMKVPEKMQEEKASMYRKWLRNSKVIP